jgi:hypothetical protein
MLGSDESSFNLIFPTVNSTGCQSLGYVQIFCLYIDHKKQHHSGILYKNIYK